MIEELSKVFDRRTISVISEIHDKKIVGIRETARKTSLPVATVYRIFKKLENVGMLKKEKIVSAHVYSINHESKFYFMMDKLMQKKHPLELFTELASNEKADQVLLLDEGENMASVMVVGEIRPSKANEIADSIKKEHGYSIKVFPLNQAQFESMESLNMKPVPKRVLFKRQAK